MDDHPVFDMGDPLPPLPVPGDPDPFAAGRITLIERHSDPDLARVTRHVVDEQHGVNGTLITVEFLDEAVAEARRQGLAVVVRG